MIFGIHPSIYRSSCSGTIKALLLLADKCQTLYMCIVVAHASVSGNYEHLISDPHFPLAKNNITSYLFRGSELANLAL